MNVMNQNPTLRDKVTEAREERIEKLRATSFSTVKLWITEAPFVSAFPDRVLLTTVETVPELLKAFYEASDDAEYVTGTIFALSEDLINLTINIANALEIELGYIANPDQEFRTWNDVIGNLKRINAMDIPDVFEPLHLPSPEDVDPEMELLEQEEEFVDDSIE